MGKRGKYPGCQPRGDSIRITFIWRGRRYRETLKLSPTDANLKAASRLRGEILRKIEIGAFHYSEYFPDSVHCNEFGRTPPLFGQLAESWLSSLEVEKSTREGYRKILDRYWLPALRGERIDRITKLQLLEVLATVTGARKTRNNVLIPARRIFLLAFQDEVITKNPAALIEYMRHQTPPPDPWTPDEMLAILAMLQKRYGPQPAAWFGLAFSAGARTSEQLAAQWSDIDFRSRIWRVQRAKVRKEEKGTKTHRARDHELSDVAVGYLEAMKPHTFMRAKPGEPSYVFLDPVTGKPYNDDKPPRERYWRPTVKALGLRYREPYTTRDTYITTAIMNGNNPTWVARQVGNSPRVLFKHYARWIESVDGSKQSDALNKTLGQIWGKTKGKTGESEGESTEGTGT